MFKSLSQRSNQRQIRYPTNVSFRSDSDKYAKERKEKGKKEREEGKRISCAARKVSPHNTVKAIPPGFNWLNPPPYPLCICICLSFLACSRY